jgi:anti-anti-sigma factor
VTSHHLVGELTIHNAAEQKNALLALLEAGEPVDLDASDVTELDTAGLQLLLLLKREAVMAGLDVKLDAPSGAVTDVLAIANLSPELTTAGRPDDEEVSL